MVAARNQGPASRRLHRAVSAQLSDSPVKLILHWVDQLGADLRAQLGVARKVAQGRRVIAVFWCDLSASDEIYLYLAEPGKGRLLVRSVGKTASHARAESVAIIIGMSVQAFLRGGRIEVLSPARRGTPGTTAPGAGAARRAAGAKPARSPETRSPPISVRRPLKRQRQVRLSLEVAYSVDSYNTDNAPLHGALLAVGYRFTRNWSIFLAYRVIQSIEARNDAAEATLQRHPLSLGAAFTWPVGRFTLGARLALVMDYVSTETVGIEGFYVDPSVDRGDWHLLAAGELRLGIRLVSRLRFVAAGGAEVVLSARNYVVRNADDEVALRLNPWIVQPYGRFGFAIDLY